MCLVLPECLSFNYAMWESCNIRHGFVSPMRLAKFLHRVLLVLVSVPFIHHSPCLSTILPWGSLQFSGKNMMIPSWLLWVSFINFVCVFFSDPPCTHNNWYFGIGLPVFLSSFPLVYLRYGEQPRWHV